MGRIGDIGAELDDMSDDAQDIIDDLVDTTQSQEDVIDQLQENLVHLSLKEIPELYKHEDIPYEAAVEFEQCVDAQLKGAGYEPMFENMPDAQRPSEMYKTEYIEPNGILETIGAYIVE